MSFRQARRQDPFGFPSGPRSGARFSRWIARPHAFRHWVFLGSGAAAWSGQRTAQAPSAAEATFPGGRQYPYAHGDALYVFPAAARDVNLMALVVMDLAVGGSRGCGLTLPDRHAIAALIAARTVPQTPQQIA